MHLTAGGGDGDPYPIPGAIITYTITVTNVGAGSADADNISITDDVTSGDVTINTQFAPTCGDAGDGIVLDSVCTTNSDGDSDGAE